MLPGPSFALTVPSDARFLEIARQFVESACSYHGLSEVADAIALATHEAMQNIIRHAHRGRPGAVVVLECGFRCDGLEVRLSDEGEPFDVAAVPRLEPGELRIGGRGVFLMRTLLDEVSSHPRLPHGNVLRLFKRRPALRQSA
jgi:serine/threonine-protein kinase RsbW